MCYIFLNQEYLKTQMLYQKDQAKKTPLVWHFDKRYKVIVIYNILKQSLFAITKPHMLGYVRLLKSPSSLSSSPQYLQSSLHHQGTYRKNCFYYHKRFDQMKDRSKRNLTFQIKKTIIPIPRLGQVIILYYIEKHEKLKWNCDNLQQK